MTGDTQRRFYRAFVPCESIESILVPYDAYDDRRHDVEIEE